MRRTRVAHKSKRRRVFFHTGHGGGMGLWGLLGGRSEAGWLKEWRAERSRWCAAARERANAPKITAARRRAGA